MKTPQDKKQSKIIELSENTLEGQHVNLFIDSKVLKILREERMDINQLFIMIAAYSGHIGLLDYYDQDSQSKKVIIMEYQDLHIHGFLEEGKETLYQISAKGKEFVEKIKPLLDQAEDAKLDEAALIKLCQDYLELFPKIKLPSQKYARVSIVEIEKKFRAWMKAYKPMFKKEGIKLTNELILKATKQYVTRYSKDNYRFMVTSSYFIQKNEKSALADEILAIGQGLDKEKTNIVTM
jgi:hypothetical protein